MKPLAFYTTFFICAIVVSIGNVEAEDIMSEMEWDTDRYDMDYIYYDLISPDPTLCEEKCANDPKCFAWTYIKPNTVQGPNPRCWLKSSIPTARKSFDCVSGSKILQSGRQMVPKTTKMKKRDTGERLTASVNRRHYSFLLFHAIQAK